MIENFVSVDSILYAFSMLWAFVSATVGSLISMENTINADNVLYCLDIMGVIACAIAGTILAQHKGLDVFGCILVSMVNAIGGGTVRDIVKIDKPLKFFDAIGLATFSVIGFKVALAQGAVPMIAVMMGVCTAIMGGMIRDIICNEIPLVLRKEIYITASIIGSCSYLLLERFGIHTGINDMIMLVIIFVVRILAIRFDWQIPSIRLVK